MAIVDKINKVFKNPLKMSKNHQNCIKFVKDMKKVGLLRSSDTFPIGSTEGNIDQLKLLASASIQELKLSKWS